MAHHQIEEIKYCRQQAVELHLCRSSDPLLWSSHSLHGCSCGVVESAMLFALMLTLCPPSLSVASTVSPLVVAVSGFLRLLFLYYVNWSLIFSMKIVCFFLNFWVCSSANMRFTSSSVCFCSKQKQQDELKQPKQLLFCGRTSHRCKHKEQQQLEEGERKLDLWCHDFRTWL